MIIFFAVVIELLVFVCAVWLLSFLSMFLHEFGHAAGYMIATGDKNWHIRVGWGKQFLNTKQLTINLLVFDGFFTPSDNKVDTKAKYIMTLLGGPVFSLLLVIVFGALRFSGHSFQSDFFADGTIEFFLNTALYINLFILLFSVAPARYFYGEVKGLETDGLQIIHAIKKHDD